jgi:hypothetical protein
MHHEPRGVKLSQMIPLRARGERMSDRTRDLSSMHDKIRADSCAWERGLRPVIQYDSVKQ